MSRRTVLFADPDAQVLSALRRIFENEERVDVETASTADEALEIVRKREVHLLVADRMPGRQRGRELLEEARTLQPDLPLILLTGQQPEEYARALETLDAEIPVLEKPWDLGQLRRSVLVALAREVEAARSSAPEPTPELDEPDRDEPGRDEPERDEEAWLQHTSLTEAQIGRARRIMGRMQTRKSLGEVLIELGEITEQEHNRLLELHRSRLSLVELLLEDGLIRAEDASAYQRAKAENPGLNDFSLLVEGEIVGEEAFLRALAEKHGIPYSEPDINRVDSELLEQSSYPYLLRQAALPVAIEDGRLVAILARPLDHGLSQELERMFGVPVAPRACAAEKIREALRTMERLKGGDGARRDTTLQYRVLDEPREGQDAGDEAVEIVDYLILRAIQLDASDLHIEPMQDRMRVRVRVDGVLQPLTELPKDAIPRVVSRVKVLAAADISERRLHQDGKIQVQAEGGEVDIRVSSYASLYGETLVLRLLHRNRGLLTMDQMDFTARIRSLVEDVVLPSSSGMLVMTGPTGSGKTTTLYSFVQMTMDPREKIITAEDPVEYTTDGLIQCSVNEKTGPTFADSLRAMMRQDPDTIIVGEMRDSVTANLAFEAALTGHKVYTTFHTEDAVTVVIRLLEMGLEPFLISSTLSTVLAQRLLRRLCRACRAPERPKPRELRYLGLDRTDLEGHTLFGSRGCARCNGTGYAGRLAIHEVLVPDDDLRDAILCKAPTKELRALARRSTHFLTLQEDAMLKALRGLTSLDELVSNVPRDPHARPIPELKTIAGRRNR